MQAVGECGRIVAMRSQGRVRTRQNIYESPYGNMAEHRQSAPPRLLKTV